MRVVLRTVICLVESLLPSGYADPSGKTSMVPGGQQHSIQHHWYSVSEEPNMVSDRIEVINQ